MEQKINEMITAADAWLRDHDFNYIECNYVPERMFTRHRLANVVLRTAYRLCPFNIRSAKDIAAAPKAPHAAVAMLKAYTEAGDNEVVPMLVDRLLSLRSTRTAAFSLRQGIRIAINLYEDSSDDPTPLNTVIFGEFLLDDNGFVEEAVRRDLVMSICSYLVDELGYADHADKGIYFYYGHHLKDVIYNASAVISAFLIRSGKRYGRADLVQLGQRGVDYIVSNQNADGSWFYYGPPHRKAIDGFHQSYILRALMDAREAGANVPESCLDNGIEFYKNQHKWKGLYLVPQRRDPRYNPRNTWLVQRLDGRDLSEAILFFSRYCPDRKRVEGLINYMHDSVFDKRTGRFASDLFVYGRNRNDYIEFYGWYLHALLTARNTFCKQ